MFRKHMAKNALLLHGTDGSPSSHWFPWLKNSLAWRGYDVEVPQLPHAEAPDTDRYWELLQNYPFNARTVIVGHSSGAVTALQILEKIPEKVVVDHVIALAPFYRDAGFRCEGLFKHEPDWDRIKSHARRIEVWWAPDDAYIEKEQIDVVTRALDVQPTVFPEGNGHFGLSANEKFHQFPELLDAIVSPGASSLE